VQEMYNNNFIFDD